MLDVIRMHREQTAGDQAGTRADGIAPGHVGGLRQKSIGQAPFGLKHAPKVGEKEPERAR